MRVIVFGKLRQRAYETDEGEKRPVYEVEADGVASSVRSAPAKVTKSARSSALAGGGRAGREPVVS